MSQSTSHGPGGLCTEESNEGEPFKFTYPPVDCSGVLTTVDVIQIPFQRDAQTDRPTLLKGELEISLQILVTPTPPPFNTIFILGLDVTVLAYNSGQSTIIARQLLTQGQNLLVVRFGDTDTWDRIVIQAASNLNGLNAQILSLPGGRTTVASLQACVLMWR